MVALGADACTNCRGGLRDAATTENSTKVVAFDLGRFLGSLQRYPEAVGIKAAKSFQRSEATNLADGHDVEPTGPVKGWTRHLAVGKEAGN